MIGNIYTGVVDETRRRLMQKYDSAQVEGDGCDECPLNRICDGGCVANNYIRSGSFHHMPPICCRWNRLLFREAIYLMERLGQGKKQTLFREVAIYVADELIEVPEYLKGELTGANVMPMCDFCTEIACETDGMACGETCSQGCHGQCTVVQCGQCSGCLGGCQICESSCQNSCQSCQSSCESAAQNPTSYGSITVGEVTSHTIEVTLRAISKATSYVIAYRPDSTTTARNVETTSRNYTLTSLEPNQRYVLTTMARTATEPALICLLRSMPPQGQRL